VAYLLVNYILFIYLFSLLFMQLLLYHCIQVLIYHAVLPCVSVRPVRYTDHDAFSATHYHISNAVVERASAEEVISCFKASKFSFS